MLVSFHDGKVTVWRPISPTFAATKKARPAGGILARGRSGWHGTAPGPRGNCRSADPRRARSTVYQGPVPWSRRTPRAAPARCPAGVFPDGDPGSGTARPVTRPRDFLRAARDVRCRTVTRGSVARWLCATSGRDVQPRGRSQQQPQCEAMLNRTTWIVALSGQQEPLRR